MPTKPMKDCMVDLETLGRRPGCVVLSAGAVMFCPETYKLSDEAFYAVVNRRSCLAAGLTEDPDTLAWWDRQSSDARAVLASAESESDSLSLVDALNQLTGFMARAGNGIRVWGCGASFDNTILVAAYEAAGLRPPWQFWNDRCHRTLKALAPKDSEPLRAGTYHNAMDDALHQAKHACNIFWWLNGGRDGADA